MDCSHADGELQVGFLMLALPFEATAKLLPHHACRRRARMRWRGSSSATSTGPSAACICGSTARLPTSNMPCCWIARFTGCTTSPAAALAQGKGSYMELVVSASRSLCGAQPREEAIEQAVRELAEFFPLVKLRQSSKRLRW
jgi:hypothetical protein